MQPENPQKPVRNSNIANLASNTHSQLLTQINQQIFSVKKTTKNLTNICIQTWACFICTCFTFVLTNNLLRNKEELLIFSRANLVMLEQCFTCFPFQLSLLCQSTIECMCLLLKLSLIRHLAEIAQKWEQTNKENVTVLIKLMIHNLF